MLIQNNPNNSISVGGLVLPRAGLKILHTQVQANTYSTFYDASYGVTPGIYQVPSGKKFNLVAAHGEQLSANSASPAVVLIYGDTSVGVNSAAAPTNPVGLITGVAGSNAADYIFGGQFSSSPIKELAISGQAPAGKFISMIINVSFFNLIIYGYEA